jgi:hypothetical protein
MNALLRMIALVIIWYIFYKTVCFAVNPNVAQIIASLGAFFVADWTR